MKRRHAVWIALGALSAACATGAFTDAPPPTKVEVERHEGPPTIVGLVTDADTDAPVERAQVVLRCDCLPASRETQTDADGAFSFHGLPAGTFTVQVFYGQGDQSKTLDVRPEQRARLRFSVSYEPYVVT